MATGIAYYYVVDRDGVTTDVVPVYGHFTLWNRDCSMRVKDTLLIWRLEWNGDVSKIGVVLLTPSNPRPVEWFDVVDFHLEELDHGDSPTH